MKFAHRNQILTRKK